MTTKIIPSAPFKNYEEIETLASKASGKVERIQIDICDGKYVPSTSWPFTEISKTDFEKMSQKNDLDVFLPDWENMNYSADLMVQSPERYIETLVAYGVDEIIIHFRSLEFDNVQEQFNKLSEVSKKFDLNFVLAVDIKTDFENFLDFAQKNSEQINSFQVMGIEKIGFQGQEFSKQSLEIVKTLKKNFPQKQVYFDGGINEETVKEIKDAGVDIFCVGSYLTKAIDFSLNLQTLKEFL